jgi:hypothetical protein
MVQHRIVVGPNEAMRQHHCCHVIAICDCVGLHFGGECALRRGATQVCNERGSPGRALKVQGSSRDKVGPR